MNYLLLGRYIPVTSILHKLDPRTKLISAVLFIILIVNVNNGAAFLALWGIAFLVMYISRIPPRVYFRGIKPILWFIIFTAILQMLFTTGTKTFFQWRMITISDYGIERGLFIFFRFTLITLLSIAVTLTTKPIDLTDGLSFLLKPFQYLKVPVNELSITLAIAFRFIPNLLDETQKVMDAQRIRGNEFGVGSPLQQMKALVPVFLPIFASTLQRSEELANVMDVRGFRADQKRSSFRQLEWKKIDTLSLCIVIVFIIWIRWLNIHFN